MICHVEAWASWSVLGVSWCGLVALLGRPGAVLGRLGAVLGRLGPVFGRLGAILGRLVAVLGRLVQKKEKHAGTCRGER